MNSKNDNDNKNSIELFADNRFKQFYAVAKTQAES